MPLKWLSFVKTLATFEGIYARLTSAEYDRDRLPPLTDLRYF